MQTPTIFTIIGFFCKLFIKRRLFSKYLSRGSVFICIVLKAGVQFNREMTYGIELLCQQLCIMSCYTWSDFWQHVYLTNFVQWVTTLAFVGASTLNVTNLLLSCGNNVTANESKVQRFATNLDEDSDDDDYMTFNSYEECIFNHWYLPPHPTSPHHRQNLHLNLLQIFELLIHWRLYYFHMIISNLSHSTQKHRQLQV